VTVVRKAADVRTSFFFKSFGVETANERVVTANRLRNNSSVMFLFPWVVHGPRATRFTTSLQSILGTVDDRYSGLCLSVV
jgi:hypothetical protein